MAKSCIEIIFIDSEDLAQKTNLSRSAESNAAIWAEFNSYRRHAVDIKAATFLLDYYNAKGDLADTIPLNDAGFVAITRQQPKAEADYRKIDSDFWNEVTRLRDAERATAQAAA